MEHQESSRPRFDEDAALEKLEQLRQDIVRSRAKRKAVSEEFEAFVRSFNAPQPPAPQPPAVAQPRTEKPPAQPSVPAALADPSEDAAAVPLTLDAPPAAAPRARLRTPVLAGGALLLLIAAGAWITWMARARAPDTSPAAPSPDTRAVAVPPASPAPAKPVTQTAAAVSELTTTRRVWVRLIVDGQRVVEGELPANARVPVTANKTVVIRTGNAGAVRLTLRGEDQGVLGTEGTVVTRSFTLPPRARK